MWRAIHDEQWRFWPAWLCCAIVAIHMPLHSNILSSAVPTATYAHPSLALPPASQAC